MAKFVNGASSYGEITEIINGAYSELYIVTPYLKIPQQTKNYIKNVDKRGIKFTIISRAENIENEFHFIVSRAVTDFPQFVKLVRFKIKHGETGGIQNGIIYLKGGDFLNDIGPFKQKIFLFNISDVFNEEYFITKKIIYLPV